MFTGIIEEVGKISRIENRGGKKYFTINCRKILDSIKIGDSIACNGICLTVIGFTDSSIKVEAMLETLSKTTSHFWKNNDLINLERAMKIGSRFDGHLVQGHIDTISKLKSKYTSNQNLFLEYDIPSGFSELIVPQGSIAINGVSLTIAKLKENSFKVAIIGHTRENANLENATFVNLEFDIIGKYVQRFLNKDNAKKISQEMLIEKGF